MSRTIIFYDDVTEFGGHEKMAVCLIGQLFRFTDRQVVFVYSETNDRLSQALTALGDGFPGRLSLHAVPFRSGKAPTLEIFWQFSQIVALSRLFRSLAPEFTVIVQGNIELSVKGIIAARLAGISAVSYLPYVYRFGDLPGSPAGKIRDVYNRLFFTMASGFIVIADGYRRMLAADYGVALSSIALVRNLPDTQKMRRYGRDEARYKLGMPADARVITIIGRIYFRTKGQDFVVKAIRGMLGEKLRLMIVGDGQDRAALLDLAQEDIAAGTVLVKEWLDDPSVAYCASDIILMPSCLEGVPLVLLEALYFGKTVLASDIPPFDEYLPPSQRFKGGDAESLRSCLLAALESLDVPPERDSECEYITFDPDSNRESILSLIETMGRSLKRVNPHD